MKHRLFPLVILLLILPLTVLAAGHPHSDACLVCQVAQMINALPEKNGITLSNAAAVIDQIHAIDRIKGDMTDDEYDQLLTLVDTGSNGSGGGLGVPVRYTQAVEAVQQLTGGSSLAVGKKFSADGGSLVDVSNAQVQLKLTNTATGASQLLTLSTLPQQAGTLSASADFYTASSSGWTYQYPLPAGTYTIQEISDTGATVNGQPFVTRSTAYAVNGQQPQSEALITLREGGEGSIAVYNYRTFTVTWWVNNESSQTSYISQEIPAFSGSTDREPEDCTHYTFAGWSEEENGEPLAALPPVTADEEYFAVYTEEEKHGQGAGFDYQPYYDGTHSVQCADCYGMDEVIEGCTIDPDTHQCIYCQEYQRCIVVFMNGSSEWTSLDVAYGSRLGIAGMPVPRKTDSIFAGWYTADGLFVYHGLAVTSDLVASAHFVPAPAAHGAIRFPQADQTVSVALGERATLSVEAENAVAYQWYADLKDNLSWRKVSGTQAAYTTDAATQASSGDQYMCVVTFADGSYATAPLFTLQVGAAVSIPQTGDSASLALWMGLAAASFIGLAALSRKAKKSC